jgi:hypothetical protein
MLFRFEILPGRLVVLSMLLGLVLRFSIVWALLSLIMLTLIVAGGLVLGLGLAPESPCSTVYSLRLRDRGLLLLKEELDLLLLKEELDFLGSWTLILLVLRLVADSLTVLNFKFRTPAGLAPATCNGVPCVLAGLLGCRARRLYVVISVRAGDTWIFFVPARILPSVLL